MSKNNNLHLVRMMNSLKINVNDTEAMQFEEHYPLSESASIEKKFKWAEDTCNYLEKNYDLDKIIDIRKECRCNDGKSIAKKIEKYLKKASSIVEFVQAFNENETFAQLEYVTDHKIIFCYPECYCSCVKRIPKELDKTWCYCTLGNAEGIFKEVFKTDVKVQLLESVKMGSSKCKIQVEW